MYTPTAMMISTVTTIRVTISPSEMPTAVLVPVSNL